MDTLNCPYKFLTDWSHSYSGDPFSCNLSNSPISHISRLPTYSYKNLAYEKYQSISWL